MGLKEWRNKASGQGLHVWILALWIYSKKGLDMHDKSDEHAEKKAKGWDDSKIVEAVGVLQHPYREQ